MHYNETTFKKELDNRVKRYKGGDVYSIFSFARESIENVMIFALENKNEIIKYCFEELCRSFFSHEAHNSEGLNKINILDSIFITKENIKFENNNLEALKEMFDLIIIIFCEKINIKVKLDEYDGKNSFKTMDLNPEILNNHELFANSWHRGQSNHKWNLLPSYYRNINITRGSILSVDYNYLKEDYNRKNISDKFSSIFNINTIDYSFLSYIQHAIGYSPLLDFSESHIIATIFALSNVVNFNDYDNNDSALFRLEIDEKIRRIDDISEINDAILNGSTYICDKYILGSKVGNREIISFSDLIDILTPKFKLINIKTNDRMKYQKGTFIYFYDCLIVNQTIFYNLNSDLKLTKYIIKKKYKQRTNKKNIYDQITGEYPHYKITHLMKPYEWFKE